MATRFSSGFLIAISLFGFISSCASSRSVRLENLDISLKHLRRAVEIHLPMGRMSISSNLRVLRSNYFVIQKGEPVDAKDQPLRKQAVMTILGDRRPYTLSIQVIVQNQNEQGRYIGTDQDERIARVLSNRIRRSLAKRPEDLNVIDDFRVF